MVAKKTKIQVNKKPFDFILLMIVLLLLGLGITMVLSASSPSSLAETGSSYRYVIKQLIAAAIGITGMLVISKIDYRKYQKFYKIIYFISVVMLLLVLVPKLGIEVNGARRWVSIPVFGSVQPSELTKIGLIVFFAAFLSRRKDNLKEFKKGFLIPIILVVIPVLILVFVQSHLSASIVIIMICSIIMIVAGSRILYFATFGTIGITAAGIGMFILAKYFNIGGFRITRLVSFMNPWADAQGAGWQVIQSLYAIGSGGLFGVGLGNSKQKYLYISEPHNDFIFAVLAEELGFVGCMFVVLLFAIFIWRGILIAMKAPDMFGSLLATGITSLIGLQAIMNIAVVTASMPVTGIALPFFSYGGTSLLILLFSVGVLLNISRHAKKI